MAYAESQRLKAELEAKRLRFELEKVTNAHSNLEGLLKQQRNGHTTTSSALDEKERCRLEDIIDRLRNDVHLHEMASQYAKQQAETVADSAKRDCERYRTRITQLERQLLSVQADERNVSTTSPSRLEPSRDNSNPTGEAAKSPEIAVLQLRLSDLRVCGTVALLKGGLMIW